MSELTDAMDAAERFAAEHVSVLAFEILEWQRTSVLADGKLRELASMVPAPPYSRLAVAENIAKTAALHRVLQATATPPPASVVERDARDARTHPRIGDVKLYNNGETWVFDATSHPGSWAVNIDRAQWFTREQWAARQKERETKTPP